MVPCRLESEARSFYSFYSFPYQTNRPLPPLIHPRLSVFSLSYFHETCLSSSQSQRRFRMQICVRALVLRRNFILSDMEGRGYVCGCKHGTCAHCECERKPGGKCSPECHGGVRNTNCTRKSTEVRYIPLPANFNFFHE